MVSCRRAALAALGYAATLLPAVDAARILVSNSLDTCSTASGFTASLFNVKYDADTGFADISMTATSTISGKVIFYVTVAAYGYPIIDNRAVDPCTVEELKGMCPMQVGKPPQDFRLDIGKSAPIPGIAFSIPDLDATAKVRVMLGDDEVACLEANISNQKTVDTIGVKWATAVIAFLALISSAVLNSLGHANAASHVAANSLSLFGYFQSQAMIGLTAVKLPPIVRAWTQDFQWTMGIIRLGFMQDIFTWYQRSTGGTPSTILDSIRTYSVQVQKRGLDLAGRDMLPEKMAALARRGNIKTGSGTYLVYGIQRVAFRSKIESTNLFMTTITWFCVLVLFTSLVVAAYKGILELLAKKGTVKGDRFLEFRNGWITVLKGIVFRLTLLGFPLVTVFCLWEFTQADSAAEVVLAVFFLVATITTLAFGTWKVITIARRSVSHHSNPAYILFADPNVINKWGFLYIQFRASSHYFIAPLLAYTFIKALFVAVAQKSGITQAIAFILLEAFALIGASVIRPWMDKPTNTFNIMICVVNFINAICLLIYTNVFDAPALVVGIFGVILFVLNAAFSLVLLLMVIVSTAFAVFRKNPDSRYQYMGDDRASFMKSNTQLDKSNQLDDLAAVARGDNKSRMFDSEEFEPKPHSHVLGSLNNQSQRSFGRHSPSPSVSGRPSPSLDPNGPTRNARQQNSSSPWQRGAGYDN
ncbi:hypothetical protein CCM_09587 [Cordyceps militaris CM01]|uniref:ML-like domain-containing protein n=1 Tax=Cordyceps militaris (strain CM01) TaxID=983644 RepID=G3JUU6_CORMM|nr:uncharacterized protein CCM_09587 [Cordyceps militaris CM01]EGX87626.1 hypothetical protein CCM_09587 [Cordyceps militaris CM01]